jgi:hypothetical protein
MAEKERGLILRMMDDYIRRMNPADYSTAGRVFLSTMQGVRSPITEQQFSPEELSAMQGLVSRKGGVSGAINYRDYDRVAGDQEIMGTGSMSSPLGNVRSTLGQFRYQYDPATGRYQIQDAYDFNDNENTSADMESRAESHAADPKYYLARWYAGETVPPGTGRDVRVTLPPGPKPRETVRDLLKRMVAEEANARIKKRRP